MTLIGFCEGVLIGTAIWWVFFVPIFRIGHLSVHIFVSSICVMFSICVILYERRKKRNEKKQMDCV